MMVQTGLGRIGVLWIALLAIQSVAVAQRNIYDSLQRIRDREASAERKVDLLNEMAYAMYDFDDSLAFVASNRALGEALELNYAAGIKQANVMVGLGYFAKGEFKDALKYYLKALRTEAPAAVYSQSYILLMLGKLNFELAEYDSSLYYYDRAINVPGIEKDKRALSNVYRNIAQVQIALWRNDEAFGNLKKAEQLLVEENLQDDYIMTEVWSLLGTYYENKLDYQKSDEYFGKMCSLANGRNDSFHLIKCMINQADLAFRVGNFPRALEHAASALKMSEKYVYPPQMVEIYFRFGDIYTELSQYDLAIKYLFQALKIAEPLGLRNSMSRIYSDLAWIYFERNNYPQALEYIDRARKIRSAIKDLRGLGNCENVTGLIYLGQRKYADALHQFEIARKIWEGISHQEGVAATLYNESLVYSEQGQTRKAFDLVYAALSTEEKVNNAKSLGISYNGLANLLIKMGRLDEAEIYAAKATLMADKSTSLIIKRNSYQVYARLFEARHDFKRAFEMQQKFIEINDSIYRDAGSVKMAEMEALYRIEQRDQEIKLLSQQAQLRESEITLKEAELVQQQAITTGAIIGVILASMLAFATYRFNRNIRKANRSILEQKEEIQAQAEELTESNALLSKLHREVTEKNEEIQAQSEELIEANQTISKINKSLEEKIELRTSDLKQAYKELDTFFYRSSHDFRRPITTFLGLAEVAKITVRDANALELFEKVRETASNLDKMLVKLQSISDVGAQHMIYKEVFVSEMLEDLVSSFQVEIERKGIRVETSVQLQEAFYSYPALVRIIYENLLENAIHFCAAEVPRIELKIESAPAGAKLTVSDNGQGIDASVQAKIFEMYFRGSERSKGNGLGLYIVKKAVEKLSGTIRFETTVHKGTIFVVELPNQNH